MKLIGKKNVKMLISFVMAFVIVCGVIVGASVMKASAAATGRVGDSTPVASGANWKYFSDGELEITSAIEDFTSADDVPWKAYLASISTISIDEGVSAIGKYAFANTKLTTLYIPSSVKTIDASVFSGSSISTIYYAGKYADLTIIGNLPATIGIKYSHTHDVATNAKHAAAATCKDKGYEGDFYCTVCFAWAKEGKTLPTTGNHSFTVTFDYKEATCSSNKQEAKKCSICGTVDKSSIKEVENTTGDHELELVEKIKDCTAEENQTLTYKCRNCEHSEEKQVSEHNYDYNTTASTCSVEGTTITTCLYCEAVKTTEILPLAPHTLVEYTVEATCPKYEYNDSGVATCIESGNGETGLKCSVCGEVTESRVVPNLHSEGSRSAEYVYVLKNDKPNCAKEGVQTLVCKICNNAIKDSTVKGETAKDITVTVPKSTAHTESVWVTITDPTCEKKGLKVKLCTVEGCPRYASSGIGSAAVKASDRTAVDEIIAVVSDTDTDNYGYYDTDKTLPDGAPVVYDVPEAINLYILKQYRAGKYTLDDTDVNQIKLIIKTAIDFHGKDVTEVDGTTKFEFDVDTTDLEGFYDSDKYYNYNDLIDAIVQAIIERESVVNEASDIISIVESVWAELGQQDIAVAVAADRGATAEIIKEKAVASEDIAPIGHNYVRVQYITNNYIDATGKTVEKYVAVGSEDGGDTYYVIESFNDNGTFNLTEEKVDSKDVMGKEFNCNDIDGYLAYHCTHSGCDSITVDHIVKQAKHDISQVTVEPTCLEKGYVKKTCSKCDYVIVEDNGSATGHVEFETKTLRESTCSESGVKVNVCKACGFIDKSTYESMGVLSHKLVPVSQAATCTEDGYTGTECSVCGKRDTTVVKATGHNYEKTFVKVTCFADGYTMSVCKNCGDEIKDAIVPATGHNFGAKVSVAASCGVGTHNSQICKVCGYENITDMKDDALAHNYVSKAAKAATCTEDGYTASSVCSICKDVAKEEVKIPALGHNFTKVKAAKAATCTEEGYDEHLVCTRCDADKDSDYKVYEKIAHTEEDVSATAPTCTSSGLTAGKKCSVCGTFTVRQSVVPATGHKYVNKVTAPTCTKKGYTTHTCSVCKNSYTDAETAKTSHDYKAKVTKPTCTKEGCTTYTCSKCGVSYIGSKVDKTGHNWTNGAITKSATAFKSGVITYTCKSCGTTKTESYTLTFFQKITWVVNQAFSLMLGGVQWINGTV